MMTLDKWYGGFGDGLTPLPVSEKMREDAARYVGRHVPEPDLQMVLQMIGLDECGE